MARPSCEIFHGYSDEAVGFYNNLPMNDKQCELDILRDVQTHKRSQSCLMIYKIRIDPRKPYVKTSLSNQNMTAAILVNCYNCYICTGIATTSPVIITPSTVGTGK